ncbi:hypothetical protein GCM10029992_37800 [Glycomyces albus]
MPIWPDRKYITGNPPAITVNGVAAVREKCRSLGVPSLSSASRAATLLDAAAVGVQTLVG